MYLETSYTIIIFSAWLRGGWSLALMGTPSALLPQYRSGGFKWLSGEGFWPKANSSQDKSSNPPCLQRPFRFYSLGFLSSKTCKWLLISGRANGKRAGFLRHRKQIVYSQLISVQLIIRVLSLRSSVQCLGIRNNLIQNMYAHFHFSQQTLKKESWRNSSESQK